MRYARIVVVAVAALLSLIAIAPTAGSSVPVAPRVPAAPSSSQPQPGPLPLPVPGVLRVGTEGVYPPYSFHDGAGKLTGYDVDMISAMGAKMGLRVQFVETPWDSMFAALGANKFDVVANEVARNGRRQQLYDLTNPYITNKGVIIVRADESNIHSLADLKGKKTAGNITSNWAEIARKAGAQVVGVDSFTEAAMLLTQGRVDAIINDELVAKNFMKVNPGAKVKIAAEAGAESQAVFATRKGSGLVPALNAALRKVQSDGEAQQIYDKYFGAAQSAAPRRESRRDLITASLMPLLKATVTTTLPLTVLSFIIGLLIAVIVALARIASNTFFKAVAKVYISIIRGTPLLVQLFIIFYALPQLHVLISPFPAAVIAFSLNVGGYAAEIIRSAVLSVPRGQWEAASTIGMDYWTTLRRIIFPQAARTAVPPLGNTLISLVKDTSLASTILVTELLRRAQIQAAPTFDFFTLYVVAAIYYWVICVVLSFFQGRLETRLERFIKV